MTIQNIHHRAKYQCTQQEWDSMGKAQKNFRIVADDEPGQVITNDLPKETKKPGAQVIDKKETKQTKK